MAQHQPLQGGGGGHDPLGYNYDGRIPGVPNGVWRMARDETREWWRMVYQFSVNNGDRLPSTAFSGAMSQAIQAFSSDVLTLVRNITKDGFKFIEKMFRFENRELARVRTFLKNLKAASNPESPTRTVTLPEDVYEELVNCMEAMKVVHRYVKNTPIPKLNVMNPENPNERLNPDV